MSGARPASLSAPRKRKRTPETPDCAGIKLEPASSPPALLLPVSSPAACLPPPPPFASLSLPPSLLATSVSPPVVSSPVSLTSRPPPFTSASGVFAPLPVLAPLEIIPEHCKDSVRHYTDSVRHCKDEPLPIYPWSNSPPSSALLLGPINDSPDIPDKDSPDLPERDSDSSSSSSGADSRAESPLLGPLSPLHIPLPDFTADTGLVGAPWSPGHKLDTLSLIHRYYCRECRMEAARGRKAGAGGGSGGSGGSSSGGSGSDSGETGDQPISPQAALDEASLQQAMLLNKESLKRKLLMRRSIPELVDQGIYPSPKTPAAYAEQRTKLERAKIGDSLRHKLEQRPERASLVEHHILEDSTADPSIQEKQRLLKRARLQDSLSGRLALRPGPLELVERNILAEPELQHAVKDGSLQFPKTHVDMDEGSQQGDSPSDVTSGSGVGGSSTTGSSSEPLLSPTDSLKSPRSVPSPPDITPLLRRFEHSASAGDLKFNFSSGGGSSNGGFAFSGSALTLSSKSSSIGGTVMNRSKKKNKSAPSKRVIKFHEYKGPPSASAASSASKSASASPVPPGSLLSPPVGSGGDTGYHAILQQQKLLLQWQLDVQQKVNAPCAKHRQAAAAAAAMAAMSDMTSPPGSVAPSPAPSLASLSSPGSFGSSRVATPQPSVTPQPSMTSQPGVTTPQPPARMLTPVTRSPAPTPSPVPPSLIFPMTSPVPPAPPPPPLPKTNPSTRILTIPRSIPVVLAAPSPIATISTCSSAEMGGAPVQRAATTCRAFQPSNHHINTAIDSANQHVKEESMQAEVSTPEATVTTPAPMLCSTPAPPPTPTHSSSNTPRINKLEDLKVADLKQECKKRNLPVSGPKPNLLNKLSAYAEEIVAEHQARACAPPPSPATTSIAPPLSAARNKMAVTLKSPPPQATPTPAKSAFVLPFATDDVSMMPISPPQSPGNGAGLMDLNASMASVMSQPLSPADEQMDVQVSSAMTSHTSHVMTSHMPRLKHAKPSATVQPMMVDPASRPPSVTPMDVDTMTTALTTHLATLPESLPPSVAGNAHAYLLSSAVTSRASGGHVVTSAGGVMTSAVQNGRLGALTLAGKQLLQTGNGAKPLQIQLTPLAHPNKPTTAILKSAFPLQVASPASSALVQLPVTTSAKPAPATSVMQAKVNLPALPGGSGALPMSAEVSIPVSGGTITIPVSQLPPHLQAQVHQQIQQQMAQQQTSKLTPSSAALATSDTVTIATSKVPALKPVSITTPASTANKSGKGGGGKLKAPSKPRNRGKNQKNNKTGVTSQSVLSNAALQHVTIKNEPGPVTTPAIIKQEKSGVTATPSALVEPMKSDHTFVTSPPVMTLATPLVTSSGSTEELVRLQQRQIEELKLQLNETRNKLQDADTQAQMHQEQLRKLALAKIATISQQNALNALLAEQARTQKQIQALAHAHNAQLSQLTQQSLQLTSNAVTSTKPMTTTSQNSLLNSVNIANLSNNNIISATNSVIPSNINMTTPSNHTSVPSNQPSVPSNQTAVPSNAPLTSLLGTQRLAGVNLSQTKIVQVINASGQPQLVLTSQPSKSSTLATSMATSSQATARSSSASVPSSPVTASRLPRASTSPLITSPAAAPTGPATPHQPASSGVQHVSAAQVASSSPTAVTTRSPPNYDEAIKHKQKQAAGGAVDASPSAMDDVLEILIRSGELPASAAQEPASTSTVKVSGVKLGSSLLTSPSHSPLAGTTISIPAPPYSAPPAHLLLPSLFSTHSALTSYAGAVASYPGSTTFANSMVQSGSNPALITTMAASPCSSSAHHSLATTSDSMATSSLATHSHTPHTPHSLAGSPGALQDAHMDFTADSLTHALSDLPLLDMEWTHSELGELSSSPATTPTGTTDDLLLDSGPGKKHLQLFTPPLDSTHAQPLLFSPTQLRLGRDVTAHDVIERDVTDVAGMEVGDWLEAMMPGGGGGGSGGGCSGTEHAQSDPILTPKPQDVLDLFNMDEADLYTPTELGLHPFSADRTLEALSK